MAADSWSASNSRSTSQRTNAAWNRLPLPAQLLLVDELGEQQGRERLGVGGGERPKVLSMGRWVSNTAGHGSAFAMCLRLRAADIAKERSPIPSRA